MINKRFIISLVVFFIFWQQSALASISLGQILDGTQNFSADFVQTVKKPGKREVYKGTVVVDKPNRFRWTIESPDKQVIVADGKKLWVYDLDLEQVTVQSQEQRVTDMPALLLSGDSQSISKAFTIASSQKRGMQLFLLKPKKESQFFTEILLAFREGSIESMTMTDGFSQKTTLIFSNLKRNTNLRDQLFQFKPPTGVDVIGE